MLMVRWSAAIGGWGVWSRAMGCLLLAGVMGCGSSVSDKPANAERRVANGTVETRTEAVQPPTGKPRQADQSPTPVAGPAGATIPPMAIPRDDDDRLNIPDMVAKDLGSSDPRDRYRALDYWEKNGSQAPIDPIYDLMEDDDPSVREKAAAILKQYMETGEESKRD